MVVFPPEISETATATVADLSARLNNNTARFGELASVEAISAGVSLLRRCSRAQSCSAEISVLLRSLVTKELNVEISKSPSACRLKWRKSRNASENSKVTR